MRFCPRCGGSVVQEHGSDLRAKKQKRGYAGGAIVCLIALCIVVAGAFCVYRFLPLSTVVFKRNVQNEDLALIELENGKTCLMSVGGEQVVEIKKNGVPANFSEGLLRITKASLSGKQVKYGFVDTSGNEVIACQYEDAHDFHGGMAAVKVKNRWGFIDASGNMIISPRYTWVSQFHDGFAMVSYNAFREPSSPDFSDGHICYVDAYGNEILQPFSVSVDSSGNVMLGPADGPYITYDGGGDFSEEYAAVFRGRKYGFIDRNGNEVVECQYYYAGGFHEGMAVVITSQFGNDVAYYINNAGEPQITFGDVEEVAGLISDDGFQNAKDFSEGLAAVQYGDGYNKDACGEKWGYIDHDRQMRIPFQFDDAGDFHDGLAAIKLGNSWGFIQPDGDMLVVPEYDAVSNFENGYAIAVKGEAYYYIDKAGVRVSGVPHDSGKVRYASSFSNVEAEYEHTALFK